MFIDRTKGTEVTYAGHMEYAVFSAIIHITMTTVHQRTAIPVENFKLTRIVIFLPQYA
jgi:hypothetical protein